jgi:hypothetical protein
MITFTNITRNAGGTWTFSWDSTGADFYRVVLSGVEIARITTTTYTWGLQTSSLFPPALEVAEEDEQTLTEKFQPYLLLQWYGEPEVQQYLVQQLVGSDWQTVKTLQEVGSWVYSYRSPTLPDETTCNYRVIAEDRLGNQSDPREFLRYVVRPPDPPDGKVRAVYESGNITILPV